MADWTQKAKGLWQQKRLRFRRLFLESVWSRPEEHRPEEQLCIKVVFAVLPGRLQPRGPSRKHSVLPVCLFLASKGLKKSPPVCQWEETDSLDCLVT